MKNCNKLKCFLFLAAIVIVIYSFISQISIPRQLNKILNVNKSNEISVRTYASVIEEKDDMKYILLWTSARSVPFVYIGEGRTGFIDRKCPYTNCYATGNKTFLKDITSYDVIAFNAPEVIHMNNDILPKKRASHQKYAFATIESSDYYPVCSNRFDGYFNWTWTFRLDSEVRWGYITVRAKDNRIVGPHKEMHWIKTENLKPVSDEFKEQLKTKTKAAAWFVSNCRSRSNREDYVKQLQNELKTYNLTLDIYGICGPLKCSRKNEDECYKLLKYNYYFYLSFENSFSEDYVTEKVLNAVQHDTVPIVFGAANYSRFLPDGSYLNAREMGPKKLAKKMEYLMKHPEEYIYQFPCLIIVLQYSDKIVVFSCTIDGHVEMKSNFLKFTLLTTWIMLLIFFYCSLRDVINTNGIVTTGKILNPGVVSTPKPTIKPKVKALKYILQWTSDSNVPFVYMGKGHNGFIERSCPHTNCFVTSNRSYLGDYIKFDVIAFSGPQLLQSVYGIKLPKRRAAHQKYVFASIESSNWYPSCTNQYDGVFNWTWTYKLDSEVRWGYIVIRDMSDNIIGPKKDMNWLKLDEMDPVSDDFKNQLRSKRKAAAWFVSSCISKSRREKFVRELQMELSRYGQDIDVYGDCGPFVCSRNNEDECDKNIEITYYFYLSFENAFSEDYVTEKLLRALKNNAVPIVYGGANYTRFMPDGAYLDAMKLGVVKLAAKMNELIQDPEKYAEYFKWKNHYWYHKTSESIETNEYCRFCELLNNDTAVKEITVYDNFRKWWNPPNVC